MPRIHSFAALTRVLLPLILVGLFWPRPASALSFAAFSVEDKGSVTRVLGQTLPALPAFASNQRVRVVGDVSDIFAAGQYVDIEGTVADNAFTMGQKVAVPGHVDGDLFAFCQNLHISGEVGGDVFAYCAELELERGAVIHGNLITGAGIMTLEGTVHGLLKAGSGTVMLDGPLGGVEELCVGSLELGPGARIAGDLVYCAAEEAVIHTEAVIEGDLMHTEEPPCEEEAAAGFPWSRVIKWLLLFGTSLVAGAVILAVLGRYARRPATILEAQPGKTLGLGFVVAIVAPIAAVVAMLLVITLPLGALTLSLYGVALYLAHLVFALWLGSWILGLMGRDGRFSFGALALGLAVFYLLRLVPYFGFLLGLLAALAGLGGIFLALVSRRDEPAPESA